MTNNLPPVDSDEKESDSESRELPANRLHFASAFVTPFAAAVAVELGQYGLSKQKIDEIMLRSAKRFGAMYGEEQHSPGKNETNSDNKSAGYLGWFKSAGLQTYDFLASVVVKHGPVLVEELTPIVMDALQQALHKYVKGATKSNGGIKSKPTPKSRR